MRLQLRFIAVQSSLVNVQQPASTKLLGLAGAANRTDAAKA